MIAIYFEVALQQFDPKLQRKTPAFCIRNLCWLNGKRQQNRFCHGLVKLRIPKSSPGVNLSNSFFLSYLHMTYIPAVDVPASTLGRLTSLLCFVGNSAALIVDASVFARKSNQIKSNQIKSNEQTRSPRKLEQHLMPSTTSAPHGVAALVAAEGYSGV